MNRTTALLALLVLCKIAMAQTTSGQEVNIVGHKHPARRPYQDFVRALSAAKRYHALAPQAELGFRLLSKPAGTDLTLRLVGDAAELPIVRGQAWHGSVSVANAALRYPLQYFVVAVA